MGALQLVQRIVNHPLNCDRKVWAFKRFLRWQIASRLAFGPTLFEWIQGAYIYVSHGELGLTSNIYEGLAEFPEMSLVLHFVRPGDLFVDVGSNSGAYTVLACAAAGADGVAVEPVPETFLRMTRNVKANGMADRVQCLQCGVGDKEGKLRFSSDEDAMNHALAEGEDKRDSVEVDVRTLDAILDGREPAMIKIDVEGFETLVLRGASNTLSCPRLQVLVVELNGSGSRYGFDEGWILDHLKGHGFLPFAYDPFERKVSGIDGKNTSSMNTIFLRDPLLVQERVKQARRFPLHEREI